ncbi:MAG TPA: protein kinase [Polyangiaceae bacterium]|jgi:serine/threonine-protein kinase
MTPPATDPPGTQAADYLDDGPVGRGSQGEVRRVVDVPLQRRLAMKLLDREHAHEERSRKMFVEEAQITAQLDHPNIPPVHRLGVAPDGALYFTMKLLPGSTLEDELARGAHHGDWGELFRVLQIFVTVCNAVAFAHARGVVHRDLKPDNVMVAERGQVYVMDWGIARLIGQVGPSPFAPAAQVPPRVSVPTGALSEPGIISGTPSYMAPEQASGRGADPRSDVFSLGAILYHVLVGKAPFEGDTPVEVLIRAARGDYEHPWLAARHSVPEFLCDVAVRAMQRDPAARYQTVDALREDVEAFMRGPKPLPERTFPAGAVIVREGDAADCAYVIVRGRARVYKTVGGREVPIGELGPRTPFGEAGLFGTAPRVASVEALEPLVASVVTREALEQELGLAGMLAPLVRQLAANFHAVDAELSARRIDGASVRIARATLLYVATHGADAGGSQRTVAWAPLREHLCRACGCDPREATLSVGSMPEAKLDVPSNVLRIAMNHYGA